MTLPLATWLTPLPLIAVLRGISAAEVDSIGDALTGEGFRILEVPLNSPDPLVSIGHLAQRFGDRCLVGAGTVLTPDEVTRVGGAGGKLIVMPHCDLRVIREAKRQGLVCVPGVATPTEAFAALDAGADGLKMFPAEQLAPAALKAWRAVLPRGTLVFPVGGMRPDNLMPWWEAGASGFGTGSNLYRPGTTADEVRGVAAAFATAYRALPQR
ncbi:MAG: 2-dehydro-3-deoxy-6-phosphogalactonate aldolase [Betaproteobacteria bacterium]